MKDELKLTKLHKTNQNRETEYDINRTDHSLHSLHLCRQCDNQYFSSSSIFLSPGHTSGIAGPQRPIHTGPS